MFKECHTERKYFEDTEKVENFWKNLWELEDVGQPKALWLDEIRENFEKIVPEINNDDIILDSKVCFKGIQKKKNWSAPGPDYIVNFWWKKLKSTIKISTFLYKSIVNQGLGIDEWYCRGMTVLIPKEDE